MNRDIPTAAELDGGLNRLLAAGLVAELGGRFRAPAAVPRAFHARRRRRGKDRCTSADEIVRSAGPLGPVPRRVTVRAADQRRAYAEYRRAFAAAAGLPS